MKKGQQVRQGDVFLRPCAKPTGDLKEVARDRVILAYGEVTGHAHVIEALGVAEFTTQNGERMVWVETPTTIQHQEHAFAVPNVLTRGWYEVVQQVEDDPLAGIRRVTD